MGTDANASGSTSKPNVETGADKVRVKDVAPNAAKTRGVALSVLGGAPQVAHPPPGTVSASTAVEKVTVWPPPEIEETLPPFGLEKVMTVVAVV